MAPAAVLTGKWATAEDTARELGVSKADLKRLKQLAALALSRPAKKSRAKSVAATNSGVLARHSKAPTTSIPKGARTSTKKAGTAKRAKS